MTNSNTFTIANTVTTANKIAGQLQESIISTFFRIFCSIWMWGFIFYITIVNICFKAIVMSDYNIYINDLKMDELPNSLYFNSMEEAIKNIPQIEQWKKNKNMEKINFIVPKHQTIYNALYLKQYGSNMPSYKIKAIDYPYMKKQRIYNYHATLKILFIIIYKKIVSMFKHIMEKVSHKKK